MIAASTPEPVPAAGPHGGDGAALAEALGVDPDDVLDLSASLNPCAPDVARLAAPHLSSLRRYPDTSRATIALAEALGVHPNRVVLTNGGAEAIAIVAALHPRGWSDPFEFSLYRRHLRSVDPTAGRWMSDPHNPTGLLADVVTTAFVRDEAFYPLATGAWTRGDAGTIVVGSLTKVFACPGLRLGYVIARDEREATALVAQRPEWSVSSLAAELLPELLDRAALSRWATEIKALRNDLTELLATHGYVASPSVANFVWVPSANGLRARLARHGVLVRDGASFGYPDSVRIAVPDAAGLARLALAIERSSP